MVRYAQVPDVEPDGEEMEEGSKAVTTGSKRKKPQYSGGLVLEPKKVRGEILLT
jgi:hypothetical protein